MTITCTLPMKKQIAAIAILTIPALLPAQKPDIMIYSGAEDTTSTHKTELVCVTVPGATATINGNPVHVYRTGSFGMAIDLKKGDNKIDITATKDGLTSVRNINIFRTDATASKQPSQTDEQATLFFDTPRYIVTKPGAYLQYGNGDDRLGGSKMGFLNDGIVLKAIGRKGSLYCVRLSSDRMAYIPEEYTASTNVHTKTVNTGSWSLTNEGTSDKLTISLPTRLAYQYSTDINPSEITIDLFGATDNSNWITQRTLDLGAIDYVAFEQMSDDTYRIKLRLKDAYQWGFDIHYPTGSSSLCIEVRHAPQSFKLKDLTIGLDAGHGGKYPGARSPSGLLEKEMNLDIVLRMQQILQKSGAKVVLTRDADTGPSMAERKRILADAKVDLSVSVHNNAGGSALSSPGTAVLYKHLFDRPFSLAVCKRMVATGLPLFGLVGNFNFSLNGPTLYPNCLVEGMFMSSLAEEEKLADPNFRQKVAQAIVDGIEDYLRQVERTAKQRQQ